MNASETNERYEKWVKPVTWLVVIFGMLMLYFFAYPVVVIFILGKTNGFEIFPEWVRAGIEFSLIPLDWVHNNLPIYERFIESLRERFL